ncbi:MAG TPA: sulfur carrier protein ThiS [Xanthobacteraceae bacterium]|nr:sulfur carrier protein ThiS [Xanthobacteraceae bacterium]
MKDAPVLTLHVNGERETISAGTLSALLEMKGVEPGGRGVAVALNGSVVPRAAWSQTVLRAGDAVEIVQAKQGG